MVVGMGAVIETPELQATSYKLQATS